MSYDREVSSSEGGSTSAGRTSGKSGSDSSPGFFGRVGAWFGKGKGKSKKKREVFGPMSILDSDSSHEFDDSREDSGSELMGGRKRRGGGEAFYGS